MSKLPILLRFQSLFLSLLRILGTQLLGLASEDVLYGEDFVKQLELLLGNLLVEVIDHGSVDLIHMLESVHHETL